MKGYGSIYPLTAMHNFFGLVVLTVATLSSSLYLNRSVDSGLVIKTGLGSSFILWHDDVCLQ